MRLGTILGNLKRKRRVKKLKALANCKGTLFVNGDGDVICPENLTIENNVHIGRGFFIHAKGGVFIGENTHISRNLVCYSCKRQE